MSAVPERVAIVTPQDEEAGLIVDLLRRHGIESQTFPDIASFLFAIETCSIAVLAEDSLPAAGIEALHGMLSRQPDWSDYPLILLTLSGNDDEGRDDAAIQQIRSLGHVTFLERPFHPVTFLSVCRTALASRRRQLQLRDRLIAIEESREQTARSDARLKFALEAGRLGAWEFDLVSRELTTSALCRIMFGRPAEAGLTYEEFLEAIFPEDRDKMQAAVQHAIDTHADCEIEYRIATPAGETRWIEIRGRAIFEGERPTGVTGVALDVTARMQAEERQDLLIRELHHRVKNTLSTVQAIVGSSARSAKSVDDFYRDFTARIISLANTHTILTEELWQRAWLRELLDKELGPFKDGDGRIALAGPDIDLPSDYAVPLGMAFHELTTNAAKYGSLSVSTGTLAVSWTLDEAEAPPTLRIAWAEAGGPPVSRPSRKGFGTRLIERVLTAQLKADVRLDYQGAGLQAAVEFRLPDRRVAAASPGW